MRGMVRMGGAVADMSQHQPTVQSKQSVRPVSYPRTWRCTLCNCRNGSSPNALPLAGAMKHPLVQRRPFYSAPRGAFFHQARGAFFRHVACDAFDPFGHLGRCRREKVISRIRLGSAPRTMRWATQWAVLA